MNRVEPSPFVAVENRVPGGRRSAGWVGQGESLVRVSASPNTQSALGTRNSFVGFTSKTFGSIKAGKNDTPYKLATAEFDPFSGTVGDYNAIVGNTGGDNRVEFDLR